jgi:hypothetical protein
MSDADVLLRRAHEAAYRLPVGFAGFSATVTASSTASNTEKVDNSTSGSARLVVRGRTDLELTVDGPPDEILDWARGELASIVGHRWATSYEEGDGRWAKRADGDTVTMLDDPFDSAYRLRDNVISEVHRTVGGARFVISVSGRQHTSDGRYLPAHFTVFHWSGDPARVTRADQFTDAFVEVDGVYLPAARRVVSATDDGLTTRVLELRDHRIGPGA